MSQILVWLVAHAVAVLAGGFLAVHLALRWRAGRAVVASTAALTGLYLLIGADSLRTPQSPGVGDWALLLNTCLLALACAAVAAQVWGSWRLVRDRSGKWKQAGLAALLLCQLGVIGWTGWRFREVVIATVGEPETGGAEMDEIADEALLTDKQRLVPLFRARLIGDPQTYAEFSRIEFRNCIPRSGPDLTTNCHGWIFTDGKYLLKEDGVQMLLDDNGYQRVEKPRGGDLILYRDPANRIVHSGLVRIVFDDGQVLVESKWGLGRRYLHLAEDQAYSPLFIYYHRDSASGTFEGSSQHLVQTVKVQPGNQFLAGQSAETVVGRSHPAVSPVLDSFGNPMPPGETPPQGAE